MNTLQCFQLPKGDCQHSCGGHIWKSLGSLTSEMTDGTHFGHLPYCFQVPSEALYPGEPRGKTHFRELVPVLNETSGENVWKVLGSSETHWMKLPLYFS